MPRKKPYIGIIEKVYRCSFEDIGLFFWVEGQKRIVPAITIEQSIYQYFKYLAVEDYNIESAMSVYSLMKKRFYEAAKKDRGCNKA